MSYPEKKISAHRDALGGLLVPSGYEIIPYRVVSALQHVREKESGLYQPAGRGIMYYCSQRVAWCTHLPAGNPIYFHSSCVYIRPVAEAASIENLFS